MKNLHRDLRIGVFGHGTSIHLTDEVLKWVELFGEYIAEQKAILYTGGGEGLMLAARRGCQRKQGSVVSVNPEVEISANDVRNKCLGNVIASGQGKLGRVHLLTQSIDIGFALGGGAGTLLEIVSCYLLAKPIIVVDGFQQNTDPKIIKILSKTKERIIEGQSVSYGYIDGKEKDQVFPVHICKKSLTPKDLLNIGLSILMVS